MSENEKKQKTSKLRAALTLALIAFAVILIIYVCVTFMPNLIRALKDGDEAEMQALVTGAGAKGVFILVALQVLQTLTIVFPGIPIYMCAGIIYGRIWGTVICYITYVVSNVSIFIFSRRAGEAADTLFNSDKEGAVSGLIAKTNHPMRLVAALCVIPLIPNGLVPHIASKSSLTTKQFFTAVAVGCIPGILLFVVCGDLLLTKYFWLIIGLMVFAIVMMIVGVVFKEPLAKMTQKILNKITGNKEDQES